MIRKESFQRGADHAAFIAGITTIALPVIVSALLDSISIRAQKGKQLLACIKNFGSRPVIQATTIRAREPRNELELPANTISQVFVGPREYLVDQTHVSVFIKYGGMSGRRGKNSPSGNVYRMKGGTKVDLDDNNPAHTFDDGTEFIWKP